MLIRATYIYHVKVVDTLLITKPPIHHNYTIRIVFTTILDKIKGQKTPAEEYIGVPFVLTENEYLDTATINYLNDHQNYFAFDFMDV